MKLTMLLTAGLEESELSAIAEAAAKEMKDAYETAKASDWPEKDLAYVDVQDIGDPRGGAF